MVGATLAAMTLLPVLAAQAQTLTTIYTFAGGDDGLEPWGGLAYKDGFLYGTTQDGGPFNAGTVFKLDPATGAKTVLHSFDRADDGEFPSGVSYQNGELYANVYDGGTGNEGTLVKVNHRSGARKLLYSFNDKSGGVAPFGRLTYQDGLFYGATFFGPTDSACGGDGCGTILTYDPTKEALSTVYTFKGPPDGASPAGDMVYSGGFFYGVTWYGGASGNGQQLSGGGTVFKLDANSGAETQLYSFTGGNDGKNPNGALTLVGSAIYGSTWFGGKFDAGVIFKIDLKTGVESVIYDFTGGSDGGGPNGGLILKDGALYGSTNGGGANFGVIFKLVLMTNTETVLHTFSGHSGGSSPSGGLLYKDHAFFGEAQFGGIGFDLKGAGTIFKLVP
jgi:uncharacterized repeat protein (TIGR03803 family)